MIHKCGVRNSKTPLRIPHCQYNDQTKSQNRFSQARLKNAIGCSWDISKPENEALSFTRCWAVVGDMESNRLIIRKIRLSRRNKVCAGCGWTGCWANGTSPRAAWPDAKNGRTIWKCDRRRQTAGTKEHSSRLVPGRRDVPAGIVGAGGPADGRQPCGKIMN